ncbi:ribosome maturation factor RimP [Phycicoccus sp. CSK15P-2]|uniref:ribosome maturation factor RimP n=1 Tax=Phycicoccus sp. CSK15P-2 TaxID=2807627 RepID=UPI00194F4708|nr:ribosome maturation factor RimP [Phycicoccus sp. CSK15P-2]MBM6404695.1 ribosome maturation factor RimP [Phycicoccus sp. CSK15P-2]
MASADRVRPVVETALGGSGFVVEDVAVTPAGKRRVVRVLLDRDLGHDDVVSEPVPPMSLDEVADATRLVGDALDASDALGAQAYTLEVSSPGVGRPLTEPRHFRRNVGRLVAVTTDDGEVTGRLTSADRTAATLEVPATKKTPGRTQTVAYTDVHSAVVQVEFARPDETEES